MSDITLPDHAYIPGQTPRHGDDEFDIYHASVTTGLPTDQLTDTLAWKAALVFFDKGFFWETHELLEPVWMATPRHSAEHQFVQGIIQLANAALKQKMGRPKAMQRLLAMAQAHFSAARSEGGEVILGQSIADWERCIGVFKES